MQVNQEEVLMLESNLQLQTEILERYEQLEAAGAFSEVQYLNQQNIVAETRGKLMQSKADRLRQMAPLLDQQTAQLKSELADLNGRWWRPRSPFATSSSGRPWMVWFLISSPPPVVSQLNPLRR